MSSNLMENKYFIQRIVQKHWPVLKDVQYKYIKPEIVSEEILNDYELCSMESSPETDQPYKLFFEYAPIKGLQKFKKLINVLRKDYLHVAQVLIEELNSSRDENQNQNAASSSPSKPRTAFNSDNPDFNKRADYRAEMGLPELPETMQYRLTGNECQEDVKAMLLKDETFAKQYNIDPHHFLDDSPPQPQSRLQNDGQGNAAYNMNTHPRGIAFIISNEKFKRFKKREGTEVDRDNLATMFHDLGWLVTSKKDLTAKEMDEYLKKLAKNVRLASVSAVAVAILTHGLDNDILFGTDGSLDNRQAVPGTFINRFQLMQNFTRTNCKVMEGKPKLFILQACRGTEEDILLPKKAPMHAPPKDIDSDAPTPDPYPMISCPRENKRDAPDTSDMCFLFSSSPGYKAYRMKSSGSPFVKTLIKAVREYARDEEFSKIVKQVRVMLANEKLPDSKMTLPEFSSLLLKDFYLNPPETFL